MKKLRNRMTCLALMAWSALVVVPGVRAEEPANMTTANAMTRATKKVTPDFPLAARQLKLAGSSEVQITVSKAGDVVEAKVVKGNAIFTLSALNAAKQWKFAPLSKDGAVTEFTAVLIFHFN